MEINDNNFELFSLLDENETEIVTLYRDGAVEYGSGYDPSRAAKVLWQALGNLAQDAVDDYINKSVAAILQEVSEEIKKRSEIARIEGRPQDENAFLTSAVMLKECAWHIVKQREGGSD